MWLRGYFLHDAREKCNSLQMDEKYYNSEKVPSRQGAYM
jgi:hypothetical protein